MLYRIKQVPHNLTLFLLAAVYLWLVVEPHLIYQCFGTILPDAPTFITGWPFLKNATALPGGFIMYLAGFLSQGYSYSWLGATIIVSSALFLCELSRRHFVAAGSARAPVWSSLPAVAVFLIYSRYQHPLPACLAVSAGLLLSLAFERLPWHKPAIRAAVYCVMAAVVFWLAGAGGLFVFSLMTVIYGVFARKDWRLPVLAIAAGLVIVWGSARYVFLISPQQAFFTLTPLSSAVTGGVKVFSKVMIVILYVLVPSSVLLLFVGRKVFHRVGQRKARSKPAKRKKAQAATAKQQWVPAFLRKAVVTALPIAVLAVGLYFSHDPMGKPYVLAHDYSLGKQWDDILEFSHSLPKGTSNPYFNHDVIRALYHTGRLPYDMFDFPQTPHGLLLTHEKKVSYLTQLKLCDTFLELGHVNLAEKLASEILATRSHSAMAIEKLAWINIIKGQNDTARIYLNALGKDLVYHRKAQSLLGALDRGFTPDQTATIGRIRSCMHHEGYPGTGKDSIEQLLTGLLDENPRNKMAFEYLMACYLLTGRVDMIAANVGRLGELGYDAIPVLYEEAILIYVNSPGQKPDLSKLKIRRQTVERYQKFVQLRSSVQPQNRPAVLKRLIVEFGNSYFFYFAFGCVGVA